MSKKSKSHRKPAQAKKVVPPAIKARNGRQRPATTEPGVQKNVTLAPAQTVNVEAGVRLPFWARMPFAIMDFWLARPERRHGKS